MSARVVSTMEFVRDSGLGAQVDAFPPRVLEIEGVLRRRNREITPEEALRFSGRGLRSFVLGWKVGSEVSHDELRQVLATYAAEFAEKGPGHPPEASAYIYGRNDPRKREDTRIVVACIGALTFDAQ